MSLPTSTSYISKGGGTFLLRKKKYTCLETWVFLRRNTNTTFGIVHFFFYRDSLREEKKEQKGN